MSIENESPSRRNLLVATAGVAAGAAAVASYASPALAATGGGASVKTVTTKDGTSIFYKDWGKGPVIVFSHGWPLSSDAWDAQMLFFSTNGFRVIAHDRRSHGRSTQTFDGNDMDTYIEDLEAVLAKLDIKDAIMVGHSTGGGEVAHYTAKYGKRVKKAVLIGAVPPVMLKSDKNPGGLPMSVFDGIRQGTAYNRPQFFKDLVMPFYGYNRPGAKLSEGVRDNFWLQGMLGGIKGQYDCIKAFSETDFTEDLKKIDCPVLLMHGDDDQIVPIADAAQVGIKLLKKGTLKVYPGYPHGMAEIHAEQINKDILEFIRA